MFGKRVTQQGREIVLREMGRARCGSGDVAIVAFVTPLDALARLGLRPSTVTVGRQAPRGQRDDG
jgi:hypothetical protein